MPAGFTHMTLSRKALDEITSEDGLDAKLLLKEHLGTFLMGSVGPDIPYMSNFDDLNPLTDEELNKVADGLHQHHTITIPLAGLELAKARVKEGKLPEAEALFAFYMGYISHIIGDGFTHPFVRDRVGDYGPTTKVAHRTLEMKLDVLVLDKYLNLEANGVAPQRDLTAFDNCEFKSEIFESYSKFLKDFHNKNVTASKLNNLAEGMIRALGAAEGRYPKWYTMNLGSKGISYMDLEDIKREEQEIRTLKRAIDADEKGILHNSLSLIDVDVFDDIFPRYFGYMPKIIEAAYLYVFEDGPLYTDLLPEINLDTGRLLTSTTLKDTPRFWELSNV